jgi:hypothetical protein
MPWSFSSLPLVDVMPPRIVGWWLSNYAKEAKIARQYLAPLVEDRMQKEAELGRKYEGRPVCLPFTMLLIAATDLSTLQNDVISWLMDTAPAKLNNLQDFTHRLNQLNFAAIHTTSAVRFSAPFPLSRPI